MRNKIKLTLIIALLIISIIYVFNWALVMRKCPSTSGMESYIKSLGDGDEFRNFTLHQASLLYYPHGERGVVGDEYTHMLLTYNCGKTALELYFSKPNGQISSNDYYLYAVRRLALHSDRVDSQWRVNNDVVLLDYFKTISPN